MKPNEAFDPYKILDIAVDADESAIRRAFRKKVRATHPDSGGSSESFQELKMAYDLLSDKERRRLFDETGDLSEKSLDPDQTKIIEILSIGLDKALFKTATDPLKYNHSKILELIRAEIEQQRSELFEQKVNFEHALHVSQDLLDRFCELITMSPKPAPPSDATLTASIIRNDPIRALTVKPPMRPTLNRYRQSRRQHNKGSNPLINHS